MADPVAGVDVELAGQRFLDDRLMGMSQHHDVQFRFFEAMTGVALQHALNRRTSFLPAGLMSNDLRQENPKIRMQKTIKQPVHG